MNDKTEQTMTPSDQAKRQARTVEMLVGRLLRIGVNASLTLVIVGSILSFVGPSGYGATAADLRHLTGDEAVFPRTMTWLCGGLRQMQGQAMIVLGLAVLIGTPVMRVAVSIVIFIYQRDRIFVAITSAVLGLLILSFVLGAWRGRDGPRRHSSSRIFMNTHQGLRTGTDGPRPSESTREPPVASFGLTAVITPV